MVACQLVGSSATSISRAAGFRRHQNARAVVQYSCQPLQIAIYSPPPRRAALPDGSRALRTWLELAGAGQFDRPGRPPRARSQSVAEVSWCGIFRPWRLPTLCGGWARLLCSLLLQRPGVCPSLHHPAHGGTAAHLNDHVFPACRCASGVLSVAQTACGTSLQRDGRC